MNSHYIPPARTDRAFGRVVRWFTDRGLSLAGTETLTVVGRTSGQPQRLPVNPMRIDGTEYLVGIRGETQWVRNARAAGRVELRRGRRVRTVTLREVPVAERAPLLHTYLQKWGWEVKRFLPEGLAVDADVDQIARHSHQLPVFALTAERA